MAVTAVVCLAACSVPGRRASPPAPLATAPAERAAWPKPPAGAVTAVVTRVVDGDTFVANVAGRQQRIRVIGVDTPETVDPRRPVEPYGKEASRFATAWLQGRTVRLAGDVESHDRFGRLLAYVWLADGTFWNALLAAEGYAQQLTIPPNVSYAALFGRLVAEARTAGRGLWAPSAGRAAGALGSREARAAAPAASGDAPRGGEGADEGGPDRP